MSRGQRINITLYDFTVAAQRDQVTNADGQGGAGGADRWPGDCQVYAIIKETDKARETAVCGDSHRQRNIYTSSTESVEISVTATSTPDKQIYFLLKYDGVLT